MNTAMTPQEASHTDRYVVGASVHKHFRADALDKEIPAFSQLSSLLLDAPQRALERLVELALRLCGGGSAGLSLLRTNATGAALFRWEALTGALADHEGATMPVDLSPCGLCMDAKTLIVVSEPGRVFKYLSRFKPSITETLAAPLFDHNREPLGAIWIARHDGTHFGAEHSTLLEQLALQIMLAMKLMRVQKESDDALELIESINSRQRKAAKMLVEESARREIAERSERSAHEQLEFKDAAMREMDHRAKNTLQIVTNLLLLQSRTASSQEVKDALNEAYRRLLVFARLHELLLGTDDDSREVPISPLLTSLTDALRQSFGERSTEVELKIAVEPITLPERVAMPLALLVNELITNAYKHAFPDGRCGSIDLMLSHASSGIVLRVSDNGVGSSSIGDHRGLGHTLLSSFAAHLKGAIVYSGPSEGTGVVANVTLPPLGQGDKVGALPLQGSTHLREAAV